MGWSSKWAMACWGLCLVAACGGRSELRKGPIPKPKVCGNGILDTGEECDDGNQLDGDGCTAECRTTACGNGVVDPGEGCDLGDGNFDQWAFVVRQGDREFRIRPLLTSLSVLDVYDYFSFSSHTGLEELETSRLFLHADYPNNRVSLVMHHGIDLDTSGVVQPLAEVIFTIRGLPAATTVELSDDDNSPETTELVKVSPNTAIGDWRFEVNSDGGIITGFGFPEDWSVTIEPEFIQGLSVWDWFDGDDLVDLDMDMPITIQAFANPSPCNTQCQIPRCGDGFLDPGELCDGHANCAADCLSLN